MNIDAYRDEIKLQLTGNLLEIELDDTTLDRVINSALRELQRYVCETRLITVPFEKCIDLNKEINGEKIKINAVARIYRATSAGVETDTASGQQDPMYAAQWQLLSGMGNLQNFQDYMYNYMSYNTSLQIRNTLATDLAFRYDRASNKLYIVTSAGMPTKITIEYVPRFENVDEIVTDYWIDQLIRLSVALTKVVVGRIRSRYTQTNAQWTQDGATILAEGQQELEAIRTELKASTQLCYPID